MNVYGTRTWITLRKYLPSLKAFPTVQSLSYHLSLLWAACKVAKLLLKSKYNLPCSIFDILPYPYSAWKSWLNELINIYIKSFCFDWMSAKLIFTILFILSPIFGILYSTFVSPRVLCRIHQVLFWKLTSFEVLMSLAFGSRSLTFSVSLFPCTIELSWII